MLKVTSKRIASNGYQYFTHLYNVVMEQGQIPEDVFSDLAFLKTKMSVDVKC